MKVKFFLLTAMVLLFTGAAFAQSATCSGMSTGAGARSAGRVQGGGSIFWFHFSSF